VTNGRCSPEESVDDGDHDHCAGRIAPTMIVTLRLPASLGDGVSPIAPAPGVPDRYGRVSGLENWTPPRAPTQGQRAETPRGEGHPRRPEGRARASRPHTSPD
jgi:hypothetical protein